MSKKPTTEQEATKVLNECLRRAFEATGIHHLCQEPRWMAPEDFGKSEVPQFTARECDYGTHATGFYVEYRIAFGVAVQVSIGQGWNESVLTQDIEISWGSGGQYAPQAKTILHTKAIEAATLYHAMRDDYWATYELVEQEADEVAA